MSLSKQFRTQILFGFALIRRLFESSYSLQQLPWSNIFTLHSLSLHISGSLFISSTRPYIARIRSLMASLPGALWPPTSLHLDAANVIYVIWSPWYRLYYIGQTVDFQQRVRRHINGFLRPNSSPQQPYMVYLTARAQGLPHIALASWFFAPIIQCGNQEELVQLETHLIHTLQPPLNEPFIQHLLRSQPTCTLPPRIICRQRDPRPIRKFTAPQLFSQDRLHKIITLGQMVANLKAATPSIPLLAAGACNTLGKPTSGQIRQRLYRISLTEWLQIWRSIRKSEPGPPRNIGLSFMDHIRRYRFWPKPCLAVQCNIPWTDARNTRQAFRNTINALIREAGRRGQAMLIPSLRSLRIIVSYSPAITVRGILRNAPVFYKRLHEGEPWRCVCHRFPHLPKYPDLDGTPHVFAPQDTWPWPASLESQRMVPAHTALIPSQDRIQANCLRLLHRTLKKIGINLPQPFVEGAARELAGNLLPPAGTVGHLQETALHGLRSSLRGLVIEEFQKTRHTLVAECPARVWSTCRQLFGADGSDPHFSCHPELSPEEVLLQSSSIPSMPSHLQPSMFSSSRSWCVAPASAPNKKRSKPNSRRPLINRSRWSA